MLVEVEAKEGSSSCSKPAIKQPGREGRNGGARGRVEKVRTRWRRRGRNRQQLGRHQPGVSESSSRGRRPHAREETPWRKLGVGNRRDQQNPSICPTTNERGFGVSGPGFFVVERPCDCEAHNLLRHFLQVCFGPRAHSSAKFTMHSLCPDNNMHWHWHW